MLQIARIILVSVLINWLAACSNVIPGSEDDEMGPEYCLPLALACLNATSNPGGGDPNSCGGSVALCLLQAGL
jgi:hypothetical protein